MKPKIPVREYFLAKLLKNVQKFPFGNFCGSTLEEKKIQSIEEFGAKIRAVRKEKNLTIAQLASLLGVGTRFLGEIENGKETAAVGKVLQVLQRMGLDLWIVPRSEGES